MPTTILIVEDDASIADTLSDCLKDAGYEVTVARTAGEGREKIRHQEFQVLILDWMLPDGTGLELCTEARQKGLQTPTLFLTAMSSVHNRMAGLDGGADDYLTKPFDMREVLARIRALLRRPNEIQYSALRLRNIELDQRKKTLRVGEKDVKLHPQEFKVLELLMTSPGRVFSPDELLARAWSTDSDAGTDAVRTTILRLRQKVDIDPDSPLITTIKGFGYRLDK